MRLLAKYNRVNIPITIAILIFSSIAYYFILHYVLVSQLDKDLLIEQQEILHYVKVNGTLPEISNYKDQKISFELKKEITFNNRFSTETQFDKTDNESESVRSLEFPIILNGMKYLATVIKSQQETEDIVQLILSITFLIIAFLLLILFIANRLLLAKLWKPFYNTIRQLKEFNLSEKTTIEFQKTEIDEFTELNKTAFLMTNKVRNDYESLKNFTENASHEIQTPLAIIKTKLELLSQSDNLDETQIIAIGSIGDATSRLSRLNQSLLLLTKIENRQFIESGIINISFIVNDCLDNLEELAESKSILIKRNIQQNVFVEMNESLCEILISNIIINSIKHNYDSGFIDIELGKNNLTISNTGAAPVIETQEFFERFTKNSFSNDSLGLGLSIVKKICDNYGFAVRYNYEGNRHIVTIGFTSGSSSK